MTSNFQPYFNHQQFIENLIKEIAIPMNPEEEVQIREILEKRLQKYLLDALFDSLETAEVRQLGAMQSEFPEVPLPYLLFQLSRTIPHLEQNVKKFTDRLKEEVLYLAEKIKNLPKGS